MGDSIVWQRNMGSRLRTLRTNRGMSQREVASAVGLRRECISNYERGERSPDPFTLCRLAEFYQASADDILGRAPEKAYPGHDGGWEPIHEDTGRFPYVIPDGGGDTVITTGDVAWIRRSDAAPQKGLVLVQFDGGRSLARVYPVANSSVVRVLGPRTPGRIVPITEVTVLGVVDTIDITTDRRGDDV